MDYRFPHGLNVWFCLALSKWNNTGNDTQQIPLKIPRAACSLLPKAQKSVLPHGNLSGLLGSFWKWFGLRQDQTRQLPSWCCHSLCLMQHKCDASREHVVVSWMRTVLIKKGYRNWDCSPGEEKVLGWPNCDLPVAEGNWLERWRGTLDRALERQDGGMPLFILTGVRWDIGKNFFPVRVVWHWHRLLVHRPGLDGALSNLG